MPACSRDATAVAVLKLTHRRGFICVSDQHNVKLAILRRLTDSQSQQATSWSTTTSAGSSGLRLPPVHATCPIDARTIQQLHLPTDIASELLANVAAVAAGVRTGCLCDGLTAGKASALAGAIAASSDGGASSGADNVNMRVRVVMVRGTPFVVNTALLRRKRMMLRTALQLMMPDTTAQDAPAAWTSTSTVLAMLLAANTADCTPVWPVACGGLLKRPILLHGGHAVEWLCRLLACVDALLRSIDGQPLGVEDGTGSGGAASARESNAGAGETGARSSSPVSSITNRINGNGSSSVARHPLLDGGNGNDGGGDGDGWTSVEEKRTGGRGKQKNLPSTSAAAVASRANGAACSNPGAATADVNPALAMPTAAGRVGVIHFDPSSSSSPPLTSTACVCPIALCGFLLDYPCAYDTAWSMPPPIRQQLSMAAGGPPHRPGPPAATSSTAIAAGSNCLSSIGLHLHSARINVELTSAAACPSTTSGAKGNGTMAARGTATPCASKPTTSSSLAVQRASARYGTEVAFSIPQAMALSDGHTGIDRGAGGRSGNSSSLMGNGGGGNHNGASTNALMPPAGAVGSSANRFDNHNGGAGPVHSAVAELPAATAKREPGSSSCHAAAAVITTALVASWRAVMRSRAAQVQAKASHVAPGPGYPLSATGSGTDTSRITGLSLAFAHRLENRPAVAL